MIEDDVVETAHRFEYRFKTESLECYGAFINIDESDTEGLDKEVNIDVISPLLTYCRLILCHAEGKRHFDHRDLEHFTVNKLIGG